MTALQPTSAALMDVLTDIESRFPVATWSAGGIPIWPLARIDWFFSVWKATYASKSAGTAPPPTGRLDQVVTQLSKVLKVRRARSAAERADFGSQARREGRRDVVFLSDGVSFMRRQGRWYERFCDPLIAALNEQGLSSILLTPGDAYLNPRWSPSLFIQPELDAARIAGLRRSRAFARTARFPQYESVQKALDYHSLNHPALSARTLTGNAVRVAAAAQAFDRWLAKYRPRIAFVVSYYCIEGMGFVLACRCRGIPVVDLQHGVQGPLHPAYGRFPAKPGRMDLIPDVFWVWSKEDVDTVAHWAGEEGIHRAVIGGNPWLNVWLRMQDPYVRQIDATVREFRAESKDKRIALVTLQPGLASPEQLAYLTQLMKTAKGWSWWVRLHPVMNAEREDIRSLLVATGARVDLDRATDLPLYGLLRHADVHLTHSSSTVLEAESCGVRSLITNIYGAELYPVQLQRGTAEFVGQHTEDMLQAMDRLTHARVAAQTSADPTGTTLRALLDAPPGKGVA